MFDNLEETKNDNLPPAAPSAPAPFPPQAKAEDIFAGVKETGVPRPGSGQAMPEPLKVANRPKGGGGVMKILIAIIVVLIVAIIGLVVASQYFGFTGLSQLLPQQGEPSVQAPVEKANQPSNEENTPAVSESSEPDKVDKGPVSGMPGIDDEPASSTEAAPVGLPEVKTATSSSETIVSTTTENDAAMGEEINDADGDMLIDREEVVLGTDPTKTDTDGDGLLDGEEVNTYKTSPLKVDTDNDGLSDSEEVKKYTTDPNKQDTDADTYLDGAEVKGGYNPKGPGKLPVGAI
jgi:cytoskeletal protein RodZ